MGPLQLYEVRVKDYNTRMRLTAADAERLDAVPVSTLAPAALPEEPLPQKRRASSDKARKPANKAP